MSILRQNGIDNDDHDTTIINREVSISKKRAVMGQLIHQGSSRAKARRLEYSQARRQHAAKEKFPSLQGGQARQRKLA